MLSAKAFGTSTLNVNNNSFPGPGNYWSGLSRNRPEEAKFTSETFSSLRSPLLSFICLASKNAQSVLFFVYNVFDGQRLGQRFSYRIVEHVHDHLLAALLTENYIWLFQWVVACLLFTCAVSGFGKALRLPWVTSAAADTEASSRARGRNLW